MTDQYLISGPAPAISDFQEQLKSMYGLQGVDISCPTEKVASPGDRDQLGQYPILEISIAIAVNLASSGIYDLLKATIKKAKESGKVKVTPLPSKPTT